MAKVIDVEGVGPAYAEKLAKAGVVTTKDLLTKGAAPAGRREIVSSSGISANLILEWVNHVDLWRIKGVGSEYADLLEEAGVDTVVELGKRVPENLLKKMSEVNAAKKLVRQMPTLKMVTAWVAQAKELPRVITY
ncbi:MAG: DUF4332 domain-containing protein [Anaerolineae bacterium]